MVGFALAEQKFRQGDYVETLHVLNHLADLANDPFMMDLLGATFEKLGMEADAASIFEQAAQQFSENKLAFLKNAARLFLASGNEKKAEFHALQILQLKPDDPDAAFMLINLLKAQKDQTIVEHLKYNLIGSDEPTHLELAYRLCGEDRSDDRLLPLFRKLALLVPENLHIRSVLAGFAREYADYDTLDALGPASLSTPLPESPLDRLLWCGNDALNRASGKITPSIPFDLAARQRRRSATHRWGAKLKIGYISSDLRPHHVVMRQMGAVLRSHDSNRFDITLFCNSSDQTADKRRFLSAFGRPIDIAGLSDAKAAKQIRRHEIDILVDLGGHTANSRAALLNYGLAPVQVSWLGFPDSTTGIDSDYIIGDAVVTPDTSAPYYGEKFCRLPETYMPNDPSVRPMPGDAGRAAYGLPDDAFVFASFNAPKKITPSVVAVWARILKGAEGSLLWMTGRTRIAEENIRRRFARLGVDPVRIVFAAPVRSYEEHIVRMRVADLGLDTFPYNGHATTSDCLWAGLPIVALKGTNFASRASESQLRATGISDLVANTEDDYCALAITLSRDRARVRHYKDTLDVARLSAPLFDSERFCRHLEAAYEMMALRAKSGLEPDHLDVPALPARSAPVPPTDQLAKL